MCSIIQYLDIWRSLFPSSLLSQHRDRHNSLSNKTSFTFCLTVFNRRNCYQVISTMQSIGLNTKQYENLPSNIKLVDWWEKMEPGYCLTENLHGQRLSLSQYVSLMVLISDN